MSEPLPVDNYSWMSPVISLEKIPETKATIEANGIFKMTHIVVDNLGLDEKTQAPIKNKDGNLCRLIFSKMK